MAGRDPSRESHFPAIEKKYGEKMKYWFAVMAKLEGKISRTNCSFARELWFLSGPRQCPGYVLSWVEICTEI